MEEQEDKRDQKKRDEKADRLSALVDNAEVLLDYNAQTRVLPSSKLDDALKPFQSENRPGYYSEETTNLRAEVGRLVRAIKPITVAELRDFYPYTRIKQSRWKKFTTGFGNGLFRLLFICFAFYLITLCAGYTVWSNRGSVFLTDVQTEISRLGSERFNDLVNRWDAVPALEPFLPAKSSVNATTSAGEDLRAIYEYHQKFLEVANRWQTLTNSTPYFDAPLPAGLIAIPKRDSTGLVASTFVRIWNSISADKDKAAETDTAAAETSEDQPATGQESSPDLATATTAAQTQGQSPRSGGGIGAPPPGVEVVDMTGKTASTSMATRAPSGSAPMGQSYFGSADMVECLRSLAPEVENLVTITQGPIDNLGKAEFQTASAAGANLQADATLTPEAIRAEVKGALRATFIAVTAREIKLGAFRCIYKLNSGDTATFEKMRRDYAEMLRQIRDTLDVRNSWILPGLYGAMGAVMLTLRMMVNPAMPRPSPMRTIIRVLLGAFVGVIIGWFWSPRSTDFFDFANISVGLFAVAFLFGYGIDIFFSILERLILAISELFDRQTNTS